MKLKVEQEVDLSDYITQQVAKRFKSFGGGKGSDYNFLADALKDNAPMFAAGVDVKDVVDYVLDLLQANKLLKTGDTDHAGN